MLNYPVLRNSHEKYTFSQGGYETVSKGFGLKLLQLMLDSKEYGVSYFASQIIKDRDFPTELVYNIVFGYAPNLDTLLRMDRAHARLDTRIVYCERRDYENTNYRDELVDIGRIEAIKEEYNHFLRSVTNCEYMTVYLEDATPLENALKVAEWLKGLEA